ncbi:MAG: DUF454 domain-containing protein [Planctomycetes bacterium]|nr:DUF454 domain-containing protein [Planctomycetota bacterium]
MRALHLLLGGVALLLAVLGVLLPLVPATPFALLASWSFARSSPRLAAWIQRLPCIGPALADWNLHHGIRRRTRCVAWLGLALGVTISLVCGDFAPMQVAAVCCGAALGALIVARLPLLETTHG